MKTKLLITGLAAALLLLPAAQLFGQMTGTSHPEQLGDTITAAPPQSSAPHYVKPSPDVYATPDTSASQTPQPVYAAQPSYATQPAAPIVSASPTSTAAASTPAVATPAQISRVADPDDMIVGSNVPVPLTGPVGQQALAVHPDPDAGIVTAAPDIPGQMNEGTMLYTRLQTPLSTDESHVGDTFLAELTQPVTQHGEVLLPIGSQIRGRVSYVHGGRRIGGPAAIHLQPDFITLPDGASRRLNAGVFSLDNISSSHVDSEGTIVGGGHPKAALTAVAAATGGAAVTGAVLGGGIGAGVGAIVGAGAGTIWWLRRDVQQELPAGTRLVFSLNEPLSVTTPAH